MFSLYSITYYHKSLLSVDVTMDSKGYSVVITRHYGSEREGFGEGVKDGKGFLYSFFVFDLASNLIVAYG
ncbi:hypothetical protein SACC_28160 [Saccharolobus caldissimus]|uniref:Uncharacterized protein n=1 Tax=Saccharolobus caldissimus TaxID=1702097 RepID=A0AAQ4CU74_9CREN|nr:hypothetical protein SACC_23720 [Saccharolobus caldissimus]BDB99799.1 hypothetical protein SACC_28160 [Saccharolobus caldissimus]